MALACHGAACICACYFADLSLDQHHAASQYTWLLHAPVHVHSQLPHELEVLLVLLVVVNGHIAIATTPDLARLGHKGVPD